MTNQSGKLLSLFGSAALALLAAPAFADERALLQETVQILDIENKPVLYHVERFPVASPVPILLVIDGSGCRGALRPGFASLFRPAADTPFAYAKITLTKPGVDPHSTEMRVCGENHKLRYSIDSFVIDHLRVLQHLKGNADWWDGRVFIWGWSEGGDIGARLTAYYPSVERSVLGAQGGGYTMAQHFEDFWDCAADRTSDREACLVDVREMFEDLIQNPVPSSDKGDTNLLWRSRMFADLATLLAYGDTPILIVNGELDRDSTPVESARLLVTKLSDAGRKNTRYCEVEGMGHGQGSISAEAGIALENATLHWLFDGSEANAMLNASCKSNPPLNKVAPPTAEPKAETPARMN